MSVAAPTGAFLDSNVVLYLLSGDARKADQAQSLLQSGAVISVQVLNEVTSVCKRKLRMPWPEIQTLLDTLKAFCKVEPLTVHSHALAMALAQQHQLSFYDAHIAASAILAGAPTLYSEDMHNGLHLRGVTIRNPFAAH